MFQKSTGYGTIEVVRNEPVVYDTQTRKPVFTEGHLARTFLQRAFGLLFKDPPGPDETLIFKDAPLIHTFFMRYPIDIIFLDTSMSVIKICRNIPPFRIVGTLRSAFTLEIRAHAAQEKKIYEGQSLTIN